MITITKSKTKKAGVVLSQLYAGDTFRSEAYPNEYFLVVENLSKNVRDDTRISIVQLESGYTSSWKSSSKVIAVSLDASVSDE